MGEVSTAFLKAEIAATKARIAQIRRHAAIQARALAECNRAEADYRQAEKEYRQHAERGPRFARKKKAGRPRTGWKGRRGLKLVAEVALIRVHRRRHRRPLNDADAIRKLVRTPEWSKYRGRAGERALERGYCEAKEYWNTVETAPYWKEHKAKAAAMREAFERYKVTVAALKGFPRAVSS